MKEVKKFLLDNQDNKYHDFSQNLNISIGYKSIGVRIPLIRSFAKTLSKQYSIDYLMENIDEEYYEEILLKGFIIGSYKGLTCDELIYYIENHLNKVIDWSMCDTFVASLKLTKKYLNEMWHYINKKLKSKKEFDVRFALVMLLNYYIDDKYKNQIYEIIKDVKLDYYYVKMANAWLLSYMVIAYYDDTITFIKNSDIDKWVINKGITKAIESYRISDKQKELLRTLRDSCK